MSKKFTVKQYLKTILFVGIVFVLNIRSGFGQCTLTNLYQTADVSGTVGVFEYNLATLSFTQIATLPGVTAGAGNSAYSTYSYYLYSSATSGVIRVYDPLLGYAYVGDINLSPSITLASDLACSGNLLVFRNGMNIYKLDLSTISSYPATGVLTTVPTANTVSPNDNALIGNVLYGIRGNAPALLYMVDINTGVQTTRTLTLNNALDGVAPTGGTWGSAWSDNSGNFYAFNNTNGDVYRITNVANPSSTVATKILLANTLNTNDGFNCEGIIPLPVVINNFTVNCDEKPVIQWQTEAEQNIQSFQVLSSEDGFSYKVATSVEANGLNEPHNYEWVDEHATPGVKYYKLAYTHFDGDTVRLSQTTTSCFYDSKSMVISENQLIVKQPNSASIYSLFTYDGKLMWEGTSAIGNNELIVDISSFNTGCYLLVETNTGNLTSTKIIIQ